MEIRARYFLVGLFVLVVAAGVVGFIYWLYNTGGLVQRTDYRVSFNGSVSGLAPGSPVLFNGLQVGEVSGLSLSADDPGLVIARISIDARTPIRTDTHVGMDFRGLTGTATVALTGGSPAAARPASEDGQPPLAGRRSEVDPGHGHGGPRGTVAAQRHSGGKRDTAEGCHRQYRRVRGGPGQELRQGRYDSGWPGEIRRRRQQARDGQLRTDGSGRFSGHCGAAGRTAYGSRADDHRGARYPTHHARGVPPGWSRPSTIFAGPTAFR